MTPRSAVPPVERSSRRRSVFRAGPPRPGPRCGVLSSGRRSLSRGGFRWRRSPCGGRRDEPRGELLPGGATLSRPGLGLRVAGPMGGAALQRTTAVDGHGGRSAPGGSEGPRRDPRSTAECEPPCVVGHGRQQAEGGDSTRFQRAPRRGRGAPALPGAQRADVQRKSPGAVRPRGFGRGVGGQANGAPPVRSFSVSSSCR